MILYAKVGGGGFVRKWIVGYHCALLLLFSTALLPTAKCWAQASGSQSAGRDDSRPQNQSEPATAPSAPEATQKADSQAKGAQTSGQQGSPIAKVETSLHNQVDKAINLPAEWFLGAYVPSSRHLQALTIDERGDVYLRQTYFTGASYLKRLFAAGIDQTRGVPYEWGGGWAGYGKRFGSRYGQFIIQNTLTSAGDAALHYEPRYDLCRCTGFWPRTRHAMLRNFVTYDKTEVGTHPQIPLYVAAFSAGALATAWKPDKQSPWRNGAYATLGQGGYGAISTWLQEFALDIGRKLSRKKVGR